MKALSMERSIRAGELDVKELFRMVNEYAEHYTAFQMEQEIFARLMQVGLAAMKSYFAAKGTGDVGETLTLPDGTTATKAADLRGRDYFSVFGKFKVPRTTYQRHGRVSIMPLDAQADLPERCYSYLLQEWMDHLSIRESFQESSGTLSTLLGLQVTASRFEVVARDSVSRTSYEHFYTDKTPPPSEEEGAIQVLGFDGKGVPVIKREAVQLTARRGQHDTRPTKKEALVGVSYTVDTHTRSAEEVADRLVSFEQAASSPTVPPEAPPTVPRAQHIRRVASLEQSKRSVVEALARDAAARDPEQARPWVVVMDGALGLWAVVTSVLADVEYVGILDIIHVLEYLWTAGKALYGDGSTETASWVHTQLLKILQGHVGRVIGGLKQRRSTLQLTAAHRKALTRAITYFENHRQWMRYDAYLAAGYPIGSGVVESTCGHTVKDRMEGCGRRWSIVGAESTLLLRSVVTSHDWEGYWESHMQQEHTRLYGEFVEALPIAETFHEPPTRKVAGI